MSIKHLKIAEQYIEEGKLNEAIASYYLVLEECYQKLQEVLTKVEKKEEKIAVEGQDIARETEQVEVIVCRGKVLNLQKKFDEEIAWYQKAAALHQNLALSLGDRLQANDNLDGASAVYQQVIAAEPEKIEAYLSLARLLNQMGLLEEAIALYRQVIAIQPGQVTAYMSLGRLESKIGKSQAAIATWQQLIARYPELTVAITLKMQTEGQLDVALVLYQQAIAAAPKNLNFYMRVGEILNLQGKQKEELSWYLQTAALLPEFGFDLGKRLQSKQKQEAAIAVYEQVIATAPENLDACTGAGEILHQEGKIEEEIGWYLQVAALQPDLGLSLASKLEATGKPEAAIAIYQQLMALESEKIDAYLKQGYLFSQMGKYEEAKAVYQQVIAMQPDRVEAYLNLGHLLSYGEKSEEAIAAYKEAIAVQPDKIEAYLSLAHLLSQIGFFEEAIATWKQAIAHQPDLGASLGERMKTEGHPEIAIAFYQQAIAVAPENIDACMGVGEILNLEGNLEEELSWYLKAGAKQPDFGFNLGCLLQAKGKQEAAIAIYQQVIARQPDKIEAYLKQGHLLSQMRKYDEAQAVYYQVIAMQPDKIEAYLSLAHLLSQIGFFEEAIVTWKQAIARQPDLATSLGERMKTEGHPEIAIAFYQQAIAVAPENLDIYCSLAEILHQHGKLDEELACYQQAAALQPDYGLNLARRLQATGKLDQGITICQQAIARQPDQVDAYLNLAHLLWRAGKSQEAIGVYQEAIAVQPDQVDAYIRLAHLLRQQGKSSQAIAFYQQAIAAQPDKVEALLSLGCLWSQMGKYQSAIACWQQAIARQPDLGLDVGEKLKTDGKFEAAISLEPQTIASNLIELAQLRSNGNIGAIHLFTLPKSGTHYLNDSISKGLDIPFVSMGNVLLNETQLDLALIKKFRLIDCYIQTHVSATRANLKILNQCSDKLVVNVRDPRQAMLSMVFYMNRLKSVEGQNVEMLGMPSGYFDLLITEQIKYQIESWLVYAIDWIESWVDAEDNPSFYPQILFTKQEDLVANQADVFESILKLYGLGKWRFTFPKQPKFHQNTHYRKGSIDEWREVFTPEQAQQASSMIPKRIFERFGWSPR